MFREFEIVIWFCFCSQEELTAIIKDCTSNAKVDTPKAKKQILNHLVNTAYFTKKQVSDESTFEQF